jgi:hypothetical protein
MTEPDERLVPEPDPSTLGGGPAEPTTSSLSEMVGTGRHPTDGREVEPVTQSGPEDRSGPDDAEKPDRDEP